NHDSLPAPKTLVQFRPGLPMRRWLCDQAHTWGLTENETARRLTALAACRLEVADYPLLDRLASRWTGTESTRPDFVWACDRVRVAFDSADRARQDLDQPPLNYPERRQFVERTVTQLLHVGTESERKK